MNAKELMIGDWVYINPWDDQETKRPSRVTGINYNSWRGEEFADWVDCEVWDEIGLNEIRPIPLTPEILERNGFKKVQIHGEKQDDIYQCFDGEIIIEIGIYDPNFILVRYRYKTPDGVNSGELSSIVKADGGKFYLHELQHALKLCGIDKTIEL